MAKMDAKTWNKLMVLGGKQGSIKLKDLSSEIGLKEEDTLVFLRHLFPNGGGIEVYHKANECWVDINANAIQYMLPLTPAEWIQLHQSLSSLEASSIHPAFESLKKKVSDSGPIRVVMEMLDELQMWEQELSESEQKFVQMLDEAVSSKKLLKVATSERKFYDIYPCKVLHLEGQLSLIAEDFHDHCLMVFPVKAFTEATVLSSGMSPKVTQYELEEFIACIRAMNEKETRLILKIYDAPTVNLFPDHHFLGKPCMVTNPNGDIIWAAYVEPCDDLYDWIASLGHQVEILDPTRFKEQFLMYCEDKLRKIA